MRSHSHGSHHGFSLIEALIASLLVASAVVGLAHLVAMGAEQALHSRRATSALTIAQSKLEQLRRVAWTFTADGTPLSSALLAFSPSRSLEEDSVGYVDRLDAYGAIAPADGSAVPEFLRRWSIAALSPSDPDTLLMHVCVFTLQRANVSDEAPAACVSAIRTRRP